MSIISKNITLEMGSHILPVRVFLKQHDGNTRQFIINFKNNGQDFIPNTNWTAYLEVTRPDGQADAYEQQIDDDGTVTAIFPAWATEEEGEGFADIAFIDEDGNSVSSMPFELVIIESAANLDNFESNPGYSLLQSLIQKNEELIGTAEDIDQALDRIIEIQEILIGGGDV